jgi:hypothetical protein
LKNVSKYPFDFECFLGLFEKRSFFATALLTLSPTWERVILKIGKARDVFDGLF